MTLPPRSSHAWLIPASSGRRRQHTTTTLWRVYACPRHDFPARNYAAALRVRHHVDRQKEHALPRSAALAQPSHAHAHALPLSLLLPGFVRLCRHCQRRVTRRAIEMTEIPTSR